MKSKALSRVAQGGMGGEGEFALVGIPWISRLTRIVPAPDWKISSSFLPRENNEDLLWNMMAKPCVKEMAMHKKLISFLSFS